MRQGEDALESLTYAAGRKDGFDPHACIVAMDSGGLDAAFLYPGLRR